MCRLASLTTPSPLTPTITTPQKEKRHRTEMRPEATITDDHLLKWRKTQSANTRAGVLVPQKLPQGRADWIHYVPYNDKEVILRKRLD